MLLKVSGKLSCHVVACRRQKAESIKISSYDWPGLGTLSALRRVPKTAMTRKGLCGGSKPRCPSRSPSRRMRIYLDGDIVCLRPQRRAREDWVWYMYTGYQLSPPHFELNSARTLAAAPSFDARSFSLIFWTFLRNTSPSGPCVFAR